MARKVNIDLVSGTGESNGNSWNTSEVDDEGFQNLYSVEDGCPECGYDGQLRSTRKGWKCPECRVIVLPLEV